MPPLPEIAQTKADFTAARDRLLTSLANTPDDRFSWAPSPTARSIAHQAAHIARTVKNLQVLFGGKPPNSAASAQADQAFREWEQQFTTREEVVEMLEKNCSAYLAWLDTVTPEQLERIIELPFGLGKGHLRDLLDFQISHMQWHTAQIDYIQTIYGDHNWNIQY